MRNVIFAINLTADGCCDHTKQFVDEEMQYYFTQLTREADMEIFGRKTYELMFPFWPDVLKDPSATIADIEFARAFVDLNKIVVSRTLDSVDDKKTRIIRGNPGDEIRELKQSPGKPILVGGVDVPSQLMALDLIDEYRFVVSPIIVGEGRRLFDGVNLADRLHLRLVDSKIFESGRIALRYLKS